MELHLPIYSGIPFVLMLGCIAVLPLFAKHFWESNRNKLIVALALGIPTAIYVIILGMPDKVEHTILFDYIPFIILLSSLFVITGGIFIDVNYEPTPKNNTMLLLIGGILASFIGTIGASTLLIRLLLNTNKLRTRKLHLVLFFIAIVANCGGLLTPLGDPPLFMMYLRGVDFFWFFNLFPYWLFVNGTLLIMCFIIDKYHYSKEPTTNTQKVITKKQSFKIDGKINFFWLLIVILAVAFLNPSILPFMKQNPYFDLLRNVVILLALFLSLLTTKKDTRLKNNFNWEPITEVAYLFLGIFLTMLPVIILLEENANSIKITTPTQFYFITGILSSVLDNTPTALTFYSLANNLFGDADAVRFVAGIPEIFMKEICLGAVFFGSITYIGNGPNFMIKSIAEQEGITMPHFFQYMIKFSLIIILPTLILCNIIFNFIF